MNGNSKIQNNVTSHLLHIWVFALCFLRFREGFRKSKGDFESVTAFSKCSCRPLHKETRRRTIDRYLTGEGPKAISTVPQQLVQLLALFIVSFDIMKRSVHVRRSVKGDEVILLKFQTTLHIESIELFKLAKPRIYRWENRERLLSSRLCNRRSTGHQSVI